MPAYLRKYGAVSTHSLFQQSAFAPALISCPHKDIGMHVRMELHDNVGSSVKIFAFVMLQTLFSRPCPTHNTWYTCMHALGVSMRHEHPSITQISLRMNTC